MTKSRKRHILINADKAERNVGTMKVVKFKVYRNTGITYEETDCGIEKSIKEWYSLKIPKKGRFDKLESKRVRLAISVDVEAIPVNAAIEMEEN